MNTALVSPSFPSLMFYAASLVLVMWTVDVARRPLGLFDAWVLGSVKLNDKSIWVGDIDIPP
jgi:hypothetical protein